MDWLIGGNGQKSVDFIPASKPLRVIWKGMMFMYDFSCAISGRTVQTIWFDGQENERSTWITSEPYLL